MYDLEQGKKQLHPILSYHTHTVTHAFLGERRGRYIERERTPARTDTGMDARAAVEELSHY
jgi:hypothetical protein